MAGSAAPPPLPASCYLAESHVMAYTRQTSVLRGTADSLLDSASYGARWVLLSPAPGPQLLVCGGAPTPTHNFGFGLCLVTAWAELDCLTRAQPLDAELELRQSRLLVPFFGIKADGVQARIVNNFTLPCASTSERPRRRCEHRNQQILCCLRRLSPLPAVQVTCSESDSESESVTPVRQAPGPGPPAPAAYACFDKRDIIWGCRVSTIRFPKFTTT
jgi:hypothetical protein